MALHNKQFLLLHTGQSKLFTYNNDTIVIIVTNKEASLLHLHRNKIPYSQQFCNGNSLPGLQQMQDLYYVP